MNERDDVARCGDGLSADLRELGAALRALPAPQFDEAEARRVFRAHGAARQALARRRWRRAPVWASAAALAISVATGVWVAVTRDGRAAQELRTAAPSAADEPAVFQPLLYAPSFSPERSYSVVRVRIPLSSLAIGPAAELDGWVEADVLVGEDGLASGIRFDPDNTLLFSTASR